MSMFKCPCLYIDVHVSVFLEFKIQVLCNFSRFNGKRFNKIFNALMFAITVFQAANFSCLRC
jgi:hypothetical protein